MAIDRPVGLGFTPDPPPGFPEEQAEAIAQLTEIELKEGLTPENIQMQEFNKLFKTFTDTIYTNKM